MTFNILPKEILKFLIPSIFGAFVFLTPIFIDGKPTIILGVIFDFLRSFLEDYLPAVVTGLLVISAFFSIYFSLFISNRNEDSKNPFEKIFTTQISWLSLRVIGAIFAILVYFDFGPNFIISPLTGGTVLFELASSLVIFFFIACLLLPFLIDYGIAEFMGTLLKKPFLLAFRLPGRASIDSLASWLGSGSVGVLITINQHEKGSYSGREAAIITTNFSIASIAFCVLVTKVIEIDHMFFEFYLSVLFAGMIAALIIPRLWPLNRKENQYLTSKDDFSDTPKEGVGVFSWALFQGIKKAKAAPKLKFLMRDAIINVMDIWFSLLPSVVAIGTIVLILAEFTPLFEFITKPIVPFLELMQIPEAESAAPAFLVGFADLYLPAVIGRTIESEMTRFIIACVSITQIIYMTEVGTLILKSNIPLKIGELFIIFSLRTAITLPIITAIAHLIYR